jgi:hypothetical protein
MENELKCRRCDTDSLARFRSGSLVANSARVECAIDGWRTWSKRVDHHAHVNPIRLVLDLGAMAPFEQAGVSIP